ncbi:hypothetical protein PRK78_002061 [Emydomyces testavorans]|uniref:Uncharacterized protein n=1 Tax=Emydomyces testavorans TaxID=2070801 RepID=A0AAF0DE50_9EURO|nr:hypothetical protein PRK78_002061 [Emydomyces testavorans]
MSSTQTQRITANCEIIWGNVCDYDFACDTDDYLHYSCSVKKDFGNFFGGPLMITCLCRSEEAAWAELDRMLEFRAKQVKRGTPMTKDERLEIFGGPRGKYKNLLSNFIEEWEERERAKPIATSGGNKR